MGSYPQSHRGFFHLTGSGWVRQREIEPLPEGCLESWRFESEQPSEYAKEQVCLTRVWTRPDTSVDTLEYLHARFGEPMAPTPARNVTLECDI